MEFVCIWPRCKTFQHTEKNIREKHLFGKICYSLIVNVIEFVVLTINLCKISREDLFFHRFFVRRGRWCQE